VIDLTKIRAGSIVTVLLKGEHSMKTGGRSGVPLNPLLGRVMKNHRFVVTLAGPESYGNRHEDAPGDKPWFVWVKPGLVKHPVTGREYVAALPSSAMKSLGYVVDGRPATAEELETIALYRKVKTPPKFLTFPVEDVVNLVH